MESFIYSINSTIPIFLVMIIGGFIKRIGVINDDFVKSANKYVFTVALPVLLFKDLSQTNFKRDFDMKFVAFCMLTTILMFSVTWILTEIFMKDDTMKGSFVQASCRSSAAILGMAFIQNMYSDSGMAPLMIVAAVPLFNIISVIVLTFKAHPELKCKDCEYDNKSVMVVNKNDNIKKAAINIAKNPIIHGIVLGLLFSLAGLNYHPILEKTVSSIAGTATPIALICIGAGFEGKKAIKKIKPTLIASFIKLILLAAVFIPIAVIMGFRNQELMAVLIMLASPATVTCYIMAKNMDNDEVLASSVVVLTTLLSSVTLTMWIFVLKVMNLL